MPLERAVAPHGWKSVKGLLLGWLVIALSTMLAVVVTFLGMSGGYAGIGGGLAGAGVVLVSILVVLVGAGCFLAYLLVWWIARRRCRRETASSTASAPRA